MPEENVQIVLKVHDAVIRGDVDEVFAWSDPDCEYRAGVQHAMEGDSSVLRGYEGVRSWLGELHELYEDLSTEHVEVRDLGERLVIVFIVRGRGAASGVTLAQTLAQIVTFREGKIIEVREFLSREAAFEAAGIE